VPLEFFFSAVLHVECGALQHPLKAARCAQIELLELGNTRDFVVQKAIQRAL